MSTSDDESGAPGFRSNARALWEERKKLIDEWREIAKRHAEEADAEKKRRLSNSARLLQRTLNQTSARIDALTDSQITLRERARPWLRPLDSQRDADVDPLPTEERLREHVARMTSIEDQMWGVKVQLASVSDERAKTALQGERLRLEVELISARRRVVESSLAQAEEELAEIEEQLEAQLEGFRSRARRAIHELDLDAELLGDHAAMNAPENKQLVEADRVLSRPSPAEETSAQGDNEKKKRGALPVAAGQDLVRRRDDLKK